MRVLVLLSLAATATASSSSHCTFPYSGLGGEWASTETWFTPSPPGADSPVVVDTQATIDVVGAVSAESLMMQSGTHVVLQGSGHLVVAGTSTPPTACVRSAPLTGPVSVAGNGTHLSVLPPTIADAGGAPVLAYHVLMRTADGVPLGVGETDVTLAPSNGQLGLVHVLDMTRLLRHATGYTAGVVVQTRHGVSASRTWSGSWTTGDGLPDWALLQFDTPWARAEFYDAGGSVWTPPLSHPAALTTAAAQLVASWPPVNPGSVHGVSGYDVEAVPVNDTGCGVGNATATARVPPTSLLSLLDVDPGGAYAVRVRGENAAFGAGEWSPFVDATVPGSAPTGVTGLGIVAIDDRGIVVNTPSETTRVGCSGNGERQPLSAFSLWARLGDDVWRLPGPCPSLLPPGSSHDVFAAATLTPGLPPRDTTPDIVTWERVDTVSTLPLRASPRAPSEVNVSAIADTDTGEFGLTVTVAPSPRDVVGRIVTWVVYTVDVAASAAAVAIGETHVRVVSGILADTEYTFSVFGRDTDGVDGDSASILWHSPASVPPGPVRELVSVATSSVVTLRWLPPVHTGGTDPASIVYTVVFIDAGATLPGVALDPVTCIATPEGECSTTAVILTPPSSSVLTTVVRAGSTPTNTTTTFLPAGAPDAPLVVQRNATGGSVTLDVFAPIETGGAAVTHVCLVGGGCEPFTSSSPHSVRVRAPLMNDDNCLLSCVFRVSVTLRNLLAETSAPTTIDAVTASSHTPIVLPFPRFHSATGGSVLVSLDWATDTDADTGGYALAGGVYVTHFPADERSSGQAPGTYDPSCSCVTMHLVGIPLDTALAWAAPTITSPRNSQVNVTAPHGAATRDRPTEPGLPTGTRVTSSAPSTSTSNAWGVSVDFSHVGVDTGGLPLHDTFFTASLVLSTIDGVTSAATAAQLPVTVPVTTSYADTSVEFTDLPWADVNATVTFSTTSRSVAVGSVRLGPPAPPGPPVAVPGAGTAQATRHAIIIPDNSWAPPPPSDSGGSAVVAYRLVVDNFFAGGGSLNVEGDMTGTGFRAQLPSTGARTMTLRILSVSRDATVSGTSLDIAVSVPPPCLPGTFDPAYTNLSAVFTDAPCVPCPSGTWSDATGDVSACPSCPAGTKAVPGSGCVACPPGTFSDTAALACSPCPAGTYAPVSGQARACPVCPGAEAGIEYALQGATECSVCPPALECPSGHLWVPQNVWWDATVADPLNGTFYPCPDIGRCSASGAATAPGDHVPVLNTSDVFALTPGCTNDRWTGVLCKECPSRHVSATGTCIACTPQWASALLVLAMIGIAVGVTAFLIKRALVNEDVNASAFSPVVVARICISHVQRLGALALLKIQGPGEFRLVSGAADVLAGISPDLIPVRCLFNLGFYDTFWVFMAAPVVSVSIAVAVVLLAGAWKRRQRRRRPRPRPRLAATSNDDDDAMVSGSTGTTTGEPTLSLHRRQRRRRRLKRSGSRMSAEFRADANVAITSAVVILFLMYVTLAKACFRMFDCYDVDIQGDVRLNAEFSVVCGTVQHRRASAAALVFGGVYLVVAPGAAFMWLWRNADRLSSPDFRRYWRFVYDVYKLRAPGRGGVKGRSGRYMWEGVVLTEKLLLIGASAFIQNARVQAISVFTVLALALASQAGARPYRLPAANSLATTSYLVVMATQLTALYAWARDGVADGGSPEPGRVYSAMLGIMLGVNTAFFAVAVIVFTRQVRRAKRAVKLKKEPSNASIVAWEDTTTVVTLSQQQPPPLFAAVQMVDNPLRRRYGGGTSEDMTQVKK